MVLHIHPTPDISHQETETAQFSPCEFTLAQEDLLRALMLVMKAIPTRSGLPILRHVHLQAYSTHVEMCGTNFETGIAIEVQASVERTGAFTLNARTLLDCVKTFPKGASVIISVNEELVRVTCGKRTFSLKEKGSSADFPVLPAVLSEPSCVLAGALLSTAIAEVQFAAATDDSRPVFTAICLHAQETSLNLVACDSHRLCRRTIVLPGKKGRDATILVPAQSMRLLADIVPSEAEVAIAWDKERVTFTAGAMRLVSCRVLGTYPPYAACIPDTHKTSFTLCRRDLISLLHAFKPFTRDSSNILRLSYATSGSVTFQASSDELGEVKDELKVPVLGDNGHILLDAVYLSDVLKCIVSDYFTFLLSGENKPCLIVPVGRQDHQSVIMPMSPNR